MGKRYIIEEEASEWGVPFFKWYWRRREPEFGERSAENPLGRHGSYPARWIARLSAWWHTR